MRFIIIYLVVEILLKLTLECCSLLGRVLLTYLVDSLIISLRELDWIHLSNGILVNLTTLNKTLSLRILRFLKILWSERRYVL